MGDGAAGVGPARVGPGLAPPREHLRAGLLLGPQGAAPGPALQPVPRHAPLVTRHPITNVYVLRTRSD